MTAHRAIANEAPSPAEDVRAHLARLLASDAFPAPPRRRKLLDYVVTQTLAGRGDHLEAYDLAISVLGRDASFDPQADPIVRIEMGRLRRDLDHFYAHVGRNWPFRIAIPKGRYSVVWEALEEPAAAAPVAGSDVAAVQPSPALVEAPSLRRNGPSTPAWPHLFVQPLRSIGGGELTRSLAISLTEGLFADLTCFDCVDVFAGLPDGSRLGASSADEKGPAFVLEGIVESELDRVRVTVRLTDRHSGQIEWCDRFQRLLPAMGLLGVTAELSGAIAGRLASAYGAIHEAAQRQLAGSLSPDDRWFAYASIQRTFGYRRTFAKGAYLQVRADLELAVHRVPDCAATQAMRAFALLDAARYDIVAPTARVDELHAGLQAAQLSAEMAPGSPLPLQALAALRYCNGEVAAAEVLQRQALACCPNDPEGLAQLAWRVGAQGRLQEGKGLLQQAMAGGGVVPSWYHQVMALMLFLDDDLAGARAEAKLGASGGLGPGFATLALIEAEAGNQVSARTALAEALKRSELLRRDPVAYWQTFHIVPSFIERFNAGLARAGL